MEGAAQKGIALRDADKQQQVTSGGGACFVEQKENASTRVQTAASSRLCHCSAAVATWIPSTDRHLRCRRHYHIAHCCPACRQCQRNLGVVLQNRCRTGIIPPFTTLNPL